MSKFYHQLKGKLNENKEDWYYLCNDAEQALFKVKEECKDESAIKSLERMIIDLNSIRMEQYERLTEYSLNEEFWKETGEKEYKGIKISIEKGDHGHTCYIPLRNNELNFIPERLTQFFSWKEVKDYIDNKLGNKDLKESIEPEEDKELPFEERVELAYNNCSWGSYGGQYPAISDIIDYLDVENTTEMRNKIGDILYKLGVDWQLEESFEGTFEGKKITTKLHNDKSNPVWVVGDISIDDKTYRVNAKVFLEGSEYGIDKGPISKLWIADSEGNCIINYDRGWDIKPTKETEEIYNIALGAVRSFRNDNPYEPDPEPKENIEESVEYSDEDFPLPENINVDIRDLCLTNGGYHNNSEAIFGRVILKGDAAGGYDIIFYPETEHLDVFQPGTDTRGLLTILYNNDLTDNTWINWKGTRVQYKTLRDYASEENKELFNLANISQEAREAIIMTINKAYYTGKPLEIPKVDYR